MYSGFFIAYEKSICQTLGRISTEDADIGTDREVSGHIEMTCRDALNHRSAVCRH
jgi:hypothetical protein